MNREEFTRTIAREGNIWRHTKRYLKSFVQKDGVEWVLLIQDYVQQALWFIAKVMVMSYIFLDAMYSRVGFEKTVIFILCLLVIQRKILRGAS